MPEESPTTVAEETTTTTPATPDAANVEPVPSSTPSADTPAEPVAAGIDYGAEAIPGGFDPPQLDVWAPTEPDGAPVLVAFHGIPTDRMVMEAMSVEFARRGYVVFNAEWQLDNSFNAGVAFQGACAVRFARENAEQDGGDPGNVTTVGYSVGGAISAALGLNGDAIAGQCASDASISGAPDRAVALAGFFEVFELDDPALPGTALFQQDPALWELLNPYQHLDQAAGTSWLLIQGDQDTTVPLAWTEHFSDALASNGADVTTHVLPGADHSLVGERHLADLLDAWFS